MILTPGTVELTAEARDRATTFFRSREGQNFLAALAASTPRIPKTGTGEDRLAGSYTHAGYEECLEMIEFFITPEQKIEAEKTNYPDLEDDRAWQEEQQRVETAQE